MSIRLAFHSSSGSRPRPSSSSMMRARSATWSSTRSNEATARSRTRCSGEIGKRLVDELGLGAHRRQRRRVGALEQVLAQRQTDDELEDHADVVAPVGRGEPRAGAVDEPLDHLTDLVGPRLELRLDGGVFRVAQPVAVDDRLHQLGTSAEVVVEGRRVALPGELVDVAEGDVEALAREQVQRGAQQLVARRFDRCPGVELGHRVLI